MASRYQPLCEQGKLRKLCQRQGLDRDMLGDSMGPNCVACGGLCPCPVDGVPKHDTTLFVLAWHRWI